MAGAGLAGLAFAAASDKRLAAWFLVAALVAFGLFRAIGLLVMRAARSVGRPKRPVAAPGARQSLHRPGTATPSVVLSLGLGLTVLVAVSLVDASLSDEVEGRLSEQAPSFFFIDIQTRRGGAVRGAGGGVARHVGLHQRAEPAGAASPGSRRAGG